MSVGNLFIISGPSGCGKTSLVNALVTRMSNIKLSVSHTTRTKRSDEQEGVNYYFVDKATFQDMINNNVFFEFAEVFGHYYGTAHAWVEQQLQTGNDVILEIDWQGAEQIRRLRPDAIGIFILPPSLQSLRERLEKRDKDPSATIAKRIASAREEISHCYEFQYLLLNDTFPTALDNLQAIIHVHRLATTRQSHALVGLLGELLA